MSGIITSVRRAEQGFFPLDKQWQLNETVYSDELGKQMVWLSGLLTYKDAARVLKRIGDISFLLAVSGGKPNDTEVVYKIMFNDNRNKSAWSGWCCPTPTTTMTRGKPSLWMAEWSIFGEKAGEN